MKVAVLKGGNTSEREISLLTSKEVTESLLRLGHQPTEIELDKDICCKLKEFKPELAFIASHGTHAEDGCIQGMLEIMGIRYTNTGVLGSAIAIDKWKLKKISNKILGIRTPKGRKIAKDEILTSIYLMKGPFILKPNKEGSSINVHAFEKCHNFNNTNYPFQGEVLLEEFIPGIELNIAVINGNAAGIIEIQTPVGKFYDYETKYFNNDAIHIKPPNIPLKVYDQVMKDTMKIHNYLGCKGITRADFIYNSATEETFFLEFNTHPGLTKKSLVPEIAKFYLNMNFDQLIENIIKDS